MPVLGAGALTPLVAVELAAPSPPAAAPAVLHAGHLPQEVHGEVCTASVDWLTAGNVGVDGIAAGAESQQREEKYSQHGCDLLTARLSTGLTRFTLFKICRLSKSCVQCSGL